MGIAIVVSESEPIDAMKSLAETLGHIVRRIRDERLLWLLGVLVIAVIAGLRDWIIFVAALVIGLLVIALSLFFPRRGCIPLAIVFRDMEAAEIQLAKCEFELRDNQNNLKKRGELAFSLEVNSWVCYLPKETAPDDIIRLNLTDRNGGVWETGPFRPLFNNKEAERVN